MSDTAAAHRARQTVINLILSLLASLGVMLLVLFVVPRDDSNRIKPVDYVAVGKTIANNEGRPILLPELPNGWWSNSARWTGAAADGVDSWYVGFVGPAGQYIGLTQGFDSNPTWLAMQTQTSLASKDLLVAGQKWRVYENPVKNDPPKTRDYLLLTEVGQDQILLYGTASEAEFKLLAKAVQDQIDGVYP
ncbi:MAG: hypothetical protein RL670_464 [Actinomycetota bacterium]